MERIGIYGGTFNPPHIGHMQAAAHAVAALNLEKILLVPAYIAPHKTFPPNTPSFEQRFHMLELSVGEKMQVCDIERTLGGTSYTFQTVEQLHLQYPDKELVLLMGTDMFLSFYTWREPQRILEHVSIGVCYRGEPGEVEAILQQKEKMEKDGVRVYLTENPVIDISSTQLRRMLAFRCADPFLPQGVETFIRENELYDTSCDYRNLPLEELERVVTRLLKPSRVAHVLGCKDTAAKMAKIWGADEVDAARAGLLHDITKALDGQLQLTLCREYGIVLGEFAQKNPKTLHALTGALVAERVFGENENVVEAIRSHTTGKANMSVLEKIIYVADYMEPNRDFPGVETLRELAFTDLDKALKLGLTMTINLLKEQGRQVSPESAEALDFLQQNGI